MCTPNKGIHQLCFLQALGEVKQLNALFSDAILFSFSLLIFHSDVFWLTVNTSTTNQKFIKTSRRQVQPEISREHVFVHELFKIYSLLRSKHKAVTPNPSLNTGRLSTTFGNNSVTLQRRPEGTKARA